MQRLAAVRTGSREPGMVIGYAKSIGMEAETCEECGGTGQQIMLDESDRRVACHWCHGQGVLTAGFGMPALGE
ncbi:MAG: hypothetical protein HQL96_01315 [Magnetococcales bacterium]|nr:hypothetical protein [Magnetococcales bacterium]